MRSPLDLNRFAVFGLGKSGVAAANLLARRGKIVTASDTRSADVVMAEIEAGGVELDSRVDVVFGRNEANSADVVVLSPGLPPRLTVFEELRAAGIPVLSEIELAFFASRAPFIAITGTDGKTTTTQLTGEIFEAAGREVAIAGNIGTPLCEVVESVPTKGAIVAEVSAFQLWSTFRFHPAVAGFTNIAADHLDYFDNMDEYVANKHRLMLNLNGFKDQVVFNFEDPVIRGWARGFRGRKIGYGFDSSALVDCDIALWCDGTSLFARIDGQQMGAWLPELAKTPLQGRHNAMNMMCAAGLALSQNISLAVIADVIMRFKPMKHRVEPCGVVGGVRFFDDSKATNAHAALAGLRTMPDGFVAIVGGVDKWLELGEMVQFLVEHAAGVVVIGAIQDRFFTELLSGGMDVALVDRAGSMEEAVTKAFERALKQVNMGEGTLGEAAVILSPACSSFDMFKSFEHRGEVFQELVKKLGV